MPAKNKSSAAELPQLSAQSVLGELMRLGFANMHDYLRVTFEQRPGWGIGNRRAAGGRLPRPEVTSAPPESESKIRRCRGDEGDA